MYIRGDEVQSGGYPGGYPGDYSGVMARKKAAFQSGNGPPLRRTKNSLAHKNRRPIQTLDGPT